MYIEKIKGLLHETEIEDISCRSPVTDKIISRGEGAILCQKNRVRTSADRRSPYHKEADRFFPAAEI